MAGNEGGGKENDNFKEFEGILRNLAEYSVIIKAT